MISDAEQVAVVAALLDALDGENGATADDGAQRVWPSMGHPHVQSWGWVARGPSAYGLSGRVSLMLGRRPGRR